MATRKRRAVRPKPKDAADDAGASMVERAYDRVLEMINTFDIRPGERLNEVGIAARLGVWRTPLREALNRLGIEGFLTMRPSKGFFCREINPSEVLELYQFRSILEVAGVRLATAAASDDDLQALKDLVEAPRPVDGVLPGTFPGERFHEAIMELCGNAEMLKVMRNLNRRLRPMRWIDVRRRPVDGRRQQEHYAIVEAMLERNADEAARLMEKHIARKLEDVDTAVRQIYGHVYVGSMEPAAAAGAGTAVAGDRS